MTGGGGGGYIPQIRLTREELQQYDESVVMVLDEAVAEFSNFSGFIDMNDWKLVRKRKQMSIYRSLQPNDDPRATLMVGTGLIPGTLEDVMNGVYCDTTADLRAVKTFLKYKFLDGAVLNVTKKRMPEAPYDFAGVKWFTAKDPWGLVKHRELLTYERMGTTLDENGNELAYHVLQSIERPEWPVGSVKGVKRERTTTCYLYRRHQNNRVQCFLWGQVYDIGSISQHQRLAEYVVAGTWLNVVRSVNSAEAKKCSRLMVVAEGRSLQSNTCHVCGKGPGFFEGHCTCVGCNQQSSDLPDRGPNGEAFRGALLQVLHQQSDLSPRASDPARELVLGPHGKGSSHEQQLREQVERVLGLVSSEARCSVALNPKALALECLSGRKEDARLHRYLRGDPAADQFVDLSEK